MDRYEIEVNEQLDARWLRRFEGLTLRHLPDGRTLLAGELPDQAALRAALTRIRDLGLTLLRVERIAPPPSGPNQIPSAFWTKHPARVIARPVHLARLRPPDRLMSPRLIWSILSATQPKIALSAHMGARTDAFNRSR